MSRYTGLEWHRASNGRAYPNIIAWTNYVNDYIVFLVIFSLNKVLLITKK